MIALTVVCMRKALTVSRRWARGGAEGLIGHLGVVRRPLDPVGHVAIDGELWRAPTSLGRRRRTFTRRRRSGRRICRSSVHRLRPTRARGGAPETRRLPLRAGRQVHDTEHVEVGTDFSDAQVAETFLHHRAPSCPSWTSPASPALSPAATSSAPSPTASWPRSEAARSLAGHPLRGGGVKRPLRRGSVSARMTCITALISARCENACGKLPRCRPVWGSSSSA